MTHKILTLIFMVSLMAVQSYASDRNISAIVIEAANGNLVRGCIILTDSGAVRVQGNYKKNSKWGNEDKKPLTTAILNQKERETLLSYINDLFLSDKTGKGIVANDMQVKKEDDTDTLEVTVYYDSPGYIHTDFYEVILDSGLTYSEKFTYIYRLVRDGDSDHEVDNSNK